MASMNRTASELAIRRIQPELAALIKKRKSYTYDWNLVKNYAQRSIIYSDQSNTP